MLSVTTTPLAKKVHAAIARSGLSQTAIAKEAGLTRAWVGSVATGQIRKAAPDKLGRLAAVLGLDHRELLALSDQLGVPVLAPPEAPDIAALARALTEASERQEAAIDRQTAVLERLVRVVEQAPPVVLPGSDDAMLSAIVTALQGLARQRPDERPDEPSSTDAPAGEASPRPVAPNSTGSR